MATSPGFIFSTDKRSGLPSPEELKRRREFNKSVMTAGTDTSPVKGGAVEAISRVLMGAMGGYFDRRDAETEAAARAKSGANLDAAVKDYFAGSGSALAYDPASPSAAPAIGADASGAANLKPADREDYAMNYLVGKGLAPHQAAGVVGNLIQESSLNTGARNPGDGRDGSDSIGVGQWNGERASGLRSFAANGGRNVGDLDTQLDYLLHELDGPEGGAGKALRSAKNVDEATAAMIGYERPAGWSAANPQGGHGWGNRIGHAQRLMQGNYGAQAGTAPQPAPVDPTAAAAPLPDTRTSVAAAYDRHMGAGQPVQVASLDPSSGMDSALAYDPRRGMDVPAVPGQPPVTAPKLSSTMTPGKMSSSPAAVNAGSPVGEAAAQAYAGLSDPVKAAAGADAAFDGFAQTGGNVRGAPAAPAAPSQDGLTERLTAMLMPDPSRPSQQQSAGRLSPAAQKIVAVLADPWASDDQKQVASYLLKDEMGRRDLAEKRAYEANDPDNALKRDYMRAQIAAMGAKQPNTTDDIREYQFAKSQGYGGSFADYQQSMKKAGAATTTIGTGENTSEFTKKSDEAAAKRLGDVVEAGNSAPEFMGSIQQLADLGKAIGTGRGAQITAALGPYADMVGIKLDGLDEAQAFNSIVAKVAPQMRPAGSGATSDFDARQFLQSLPSLGNTPGGNEMIADTFRAVSENRMAAAEIAQRAQSGELKWQEAERQIRQLPNPYERFKTFQQGGGRNGAPPAGGQAAPGTPQAPAAPPQAPAGSMGGNWPQGGQVARPRTDAEFNALKPGSLYVDPDDGMTYRK